VSASWKGSTRNGQEQRYTCNRALWWFFGPYILHYWVLFIYVLAIHTA
jgi:hypothetical protein